MNKPRDAIVVCSHLLKTDAFFSSFAIAINDNEPPEWIELIPAGKFSAVDGRGPFENDDPDSIIAESVAKMPKVGLVLDYDHSTDLAAPEGRPAPAAGWLKQFKVEQGSILARIEWTADAAEAVKAKKYRYVSPVFEHSKEGKVERILRAALTNNPALINLPALASARIAEADSPLFNSPPRQGESRKGIARDLLNLLDRWKEQARRWSGSGDSLAAPADQTEGKVGVFGVARMAKQENDKQMKLSEVMAVLEEAYPDAGPEKLMKAAACLIADDGDEDMHAADGDPYENETEEQMAAQQAEQMAKCASDGEREAMAKKHMAEKARFAERRDRNRGLEAKADMADQKGDKSLQAAIAKHPMVVRMAGELNQMRVEQAKASATEKVDQAIREGRLIPSQREWAIEYCSADAYGFEKFIGAQPRIIQSGADGTFTGRIGEAKEEVLSQKELSICQNLGLASQFGGIDKAIEKFAAAKKQRLSQNAHLD